MPRRQPLIRGISIRLAGVVLACGATAAGIVVLRQSRLQMAHEMSMAHTRIHRQHETLLELRAEIAGRTTPAAVERMLVEAGINPDDWIPLDPVAAAMSRADDPEGR